MSLGGRPAIACTLALAGLLPGCRDIPPPGVTDVRIESPLLYYAERGFVPMVPPVHLPSSSPERDQVEVWVWLPQDDVIELSDDAMGRPTLRFPAGTWADRVEFVGRGDERRIVDIRGTRIEADGSQTFYVYRPTAPNPRAPLLGVEWPRDDARALEGATERLLAKLAETVPVRDWDEPARERFLQGVRARQGCAGCHGLDRPDNETPGQHGLVDRGTDRSGFFTPQTVLWDEVVVEAYSAHDRSWDDPSIEILCDGQLYEGPAARRCPDGSIAKGRLRWDATEPAARARLRDICESRKALTAHMTPENRAKMAPADGPCAQM